MKTKSILLLALLAAADTGVTNVNVTVQESKSTSVQPSKPVVIYYPPQTPSYYFYRPFGW